MSKKPVIAIVGATGVVGRECIKLFEERNFPLNDIKLFASSQSVGIKIPFNSDELSVQEITDQILQDVDIAIFSAGSEVSKKYAPIAVSSGCVVIDNSSHWRMDDRCPLVIPEVNAHTLDNHRGIIANPNCSTIQLIVVLAPLHNIGKIKRIIVSTYQSVSGTGQKGINEIEKQTRQIFNLQQPEVTIYPHRIAFNCIPHIDSFLDNDYTKEEMKITNETKKIFDDPAIKVTATCVRVPVFYGHSESVNIEMENKITPQQARAILSQAPGVCVYDNPKENMYPTPLDATGEDLTFVGRIREDHSIDNGLNLWIVADNVRKGAALNAIQIAEHLVNNDLLTIDNPNLFL